MGSDLGFVEYVVDQLDDDCGITYKRMFGEFGLYSHGKLVALVCDDRLFMKPTDVGREYIGDVVESPPYPGAKPSFLIGSEIEDGEWLSELVRISAAALPEPKPRKPKKKQKKG
ncbi:MAG: TfoX/Sxy family protein [Gemmatimonadota bacterium]|jgi:TfoX/Sxy family transcriptional regulator of competence genes